MTADIYANDRTYMSDDVGVCVLMSAPRHAMTAWTNCNVAIDVLHGLLNRNRDFRTFVAKTGRMVRDRTKINRVTS
jgi:hypothetical protein